MGKYYAVKVGKKEGIYTSWEECKENVDGFSGAKYKSFNTYDDAKNYLIDNISKSKKIQTNYPFAYTDGSYDIKTNRYSYGCVLVLHKDKIFKFKKAFGPDSFSEHRNVSGEILGAMFIIQLCVDNNIQNIDIYYDYEGIESWYTFNWKANKKISMMYQQFSKKMHNLINVNFKKVSAHTGVYYNEIVDKLAKEALGIK